jgi:hypothetical protein
LRVPSASPRTVLQLGSMPFHLWLHCLSVRPGTSAAMTFQFFSPCVRTASFSLVTSSSDHLPARAVAGSMLETKLYHLLLHCNNVRPGISAAIALQCLPPCVCTASFSLMSSSSDYLPARAQDIMPSATTLLSRSTRDQRGNCTPILATVRLYRILELDVFFF